MTPQELEYCAALVDLFLEEKLPDLAEEPIRVPRQRRNHRPDPEILQP